MRSHTPAASECPRTQLVAAFLLCAVLALAAAGACLLAGCSSSGSAPSPAASPSPSETPHPGGTYHFPLEDITPVVSPLGRMIQDDFGFRIGHQIYEALTAFKGLADGSVAVVPCLAQSWTANGDATVWTVRLRRGVTFQQPVGREMTAADVVADIRYGADPAHRVELAYTFSAIAGTDDQGHGDGSRLGVEALDRYTVRFTLKSPLSSFPAVLGGTAFWVWPPEYLRRVGRARFDRQPVGTGPFVLSRLVAGQYADLVRNPDWWDAASGRPYLDRVHFTAYPSVAAELLAFQKGDIDYTWVPQGQVAASRTLPQVQSGSWSTQTVQLMAIGYLAFNMDDPVTGGDQGLALRQAVNYLCYRKEMIAEGTDGVFVPPTGLVPPVIAGWEQNMFPQTYDPARAADLYRAAGSPPLVLTLPRDRLAISAARVLRASCAGVGIQLRLRILPWSRYQSLFTDEGGPAMFLYGWVADYPAADSFLYDMYHSGQSTKIGTAYYDPEVDRLLEQAEAAPDAQRNLAYNKEAARRIIADLPLLPLFEYADYRLTSNHIGGFRESPLHLIDMWELWVR